MDDDGNDCSAILDAHLGTDLQNELTGSLSQHEQKSLSRHEKLLANEFARRNADGGSVDRPAAPGFWNPWHKRTDQKGHRR